MNKAFGTACTILHHLNCNDIHDVVFSHNANVRLAMDDEQTIDGIRSVVQFFNNEGQLD